MEAARDEVTISVCIPYDKGTFVSMIHERCQIVRERYEQDGLVATLKADAQMANVLAPYSISDADREDDPGELWEASGEDGA